MYREYNLIEGRIIYGKVAGPWQERNKEAEEEQKVEAAERRRGWRAQALNTPARGKIYDSFRVDSTTQQ
jgi:hypothetical protein